MINTSRAKESVESARAKTRPGGDERGKSEEGVVRDGK